MRRTALGVAPRVVACAVAGLILVPTEAGALGADSLSNGAIENMSTDHSHTRTEAVAHAQRFDVIVATAEAYRDHVSAMKAANPKLLLLVYLNGTFAHDTQGSLYPSTWYLRNKSGSKVRSNGYGNYLMNPNISGWRQNRGNFCLEQLSRSGYDGCSIDMLGTAPLEPGYLTSQPINPATGAPFTESQWMQATASVATAVKAAAGTRPTYANGLRNGVQYFSAGGPSELLLDGADGGLAESWLRASSWTIGHYRTEAEWLLDVKMLIDAEARGDGVVTITKVWTTGTAAQKDAWHEYAMASFLLGSGPRSRFSFSYDRSDPPVRDHAWWKPALGTPTAKFVKLDGVYQRPYTAGKVLVNPTGATIKVSLGAAYVDLRGNRITAVTMGPNSGKVLRKA